MSNYSHCKNCGALLYGPDEFKSHVCTNAPRSETRAALPLGESAGSAGSDEKAPVSGVAEALLQRIDAAIERITGGQACMRIPAEDTDPDLVLADCREYLRALQGVKE